MMKGSCDDDDDDDGGGGGGGDAYDSDDGDDDAGASAAVVQWRDGPDDQRWTEGTAKTAHEKGTTLQEWPIGWSVVGLSVCLLTCFVLVVVLLVMQSCSATTLRFSRCWGGAQCKTHVHTAVHVVTAFHSQSLISNGLVPKQSTDYPDSPVSASRPVLLFCFCVMR